MKKIIGIIPARGGSKGVPRKNIRMINGRPLLAYSIDSAQESKRLSYFFVSTEDEQIADIALSLGANVILRPQDLAQDNTPIDPVLKHAIAYVENKFKITCDLGVLLQPTVPLRKGSDIDNAIQIQEETGADSVVSVTRVHDFHPARMYRLIDGSLSPFTEEPLGRMRQNLPPVYHRNGAVYVFKRDLLFKNNAIIGQAPKPYVMENRTVNVDNELDLEFAEFFVKRNLKSYSEKSS